jgi:thiol-disulfide isomerase/thioredoxin
MRTKVAILVLLIGLQVTAIAQTAEIKGSMSGLKAGDTIVMRLFNRYIIDKKNDFQVLKIIYTSGTMLFKPVLQEAPRYVSLLFPDQPAGQAQKFDAEYMLIEPNDVIELPDASKPTMGRSDFKWNLQIKIKRLQNQCNGILASKQTADVAGRFKVIDSMTVACLKLIFDTIKGSSELKEILNADVIAYGRILRTSGMFARVNRTSGVRNFIRNYREPGNNGVAAKLLFTNKNFGALTAEGIIEKYLLDSCIALDRSFTLTGCFLYCKNAYTGLFREQLITSLLYKYRKRPDFNRCLQDALLFVKDPELVGKLKNIEKVGHAAYRFSLTDINGDTVNLEQFRGKKILLDFWFTGCGPCRELTKIMRILEAQLMSKNLVFISVNIDKDPNAWRKSIESGRYTLPHSIDVSTGVAGQSHPLLLDLMISSYPTLILIDEKGNMLRQPANPVKDNGADLLSLL